MPRPYERNTFRPTPWVQGRSPGRGGGKGVQRVWGNIDVPPDPLARAERKSILSVTAT